MNSLKVLVYIILLIIFTLICCIFFIKPKVFDFKVTQEYEYIQNNKMDIDEIIIRLNSQLGEYCYRLDVESGYDILNNIEIKKEAELWCSDSSKYLEFYFNDGTYKEIYFECVNLLYNNVYYELEDEIILVNKDDYMPDKITKGMIIVSNENKIDCK